MVLYIPGGVGFQPSTVGIIFEDFTLIRISKAWTVYFRGYDMQTERVGVWKDSLIIFLHVFLWEAHPFKRKGSTHELRQPCCKKQQQLLANWYSCSKKIRPQTGNIGSILAETSWDPFTFCWGSPHLRLCLDCHLCHLLPGKTVVEGKTEVLLMAEIRLINHLGCIKPVVNHGINYQPQLVRRISSINSITFKTVTLPETNIAPENRPPQKESSLPTTIFQVLC